MGAENQSEYRDARFGYRRGNRRLNLRPRKRPPDPGPLALHLSPLQNSPLAAAALFAAARSRRTLAEDIPQN